MSSLGPSAIGRQQGKLDTDNNGLSRYSLKIETPSGILSGNEPNLSLEYSQGTPNGVLGYSWCLGGISSITRSAARLVYDKLNPPPVGYDSTTPKLVLDGVDLLNIDGNYFKTNTVYSTEVNNNGLKVNTLKGDPSTGKDGGFTTVDHTGRKTDYGTSLDSRIVSAKFAPVAREWQIKKSTDIHGNTIVYNYTTVPTTSGAAAGDSGTSYLDTIEYCGSTTVAASRYVQFSYGPRPDSVKQSTGGDVVIWANRMSMISIGTIIGGAKQIQRTYALSYVPSTITQDSALTSVTESSVSSGLAQPSVELLPTTFTYTTPQTDPSAPRFQSMTAGPLSAPADLMALVPLNMTGRGLGDMACLSWEKSSTTLNINTFTAERSTPDSNKLVTASWTASPTPVSLSLPNLDPSKPPTVMTPDLNGDGRSDLIIPFSNSQKNLEFFLSQSNGISLTATPKNITTLVPWDTTSIFMAMDMTGSGTVDVVQIYSNPGAESSSPPKISFRNFPGKSDSSGISLGAGIETHTVDAFNNTIGWFLLKQAGTSAVSLMRIWKDSASGSTSYAIKATSYKCAKAGDSADGFATTGVTSVLTQQDSANGNDPYWNVLICDINGDGNQDIVLATASLSDSNISFKYLVSLGDGFGSFYEAFTIDRTVKPPSPPAVSPDSSSIAGQFSVTNLSGGLYPSLSYVFTDAKPGNYWCASVDGCSDGTVTSTMALYPLTTSAPGLPAAQVMPLDITGNGMGDWLIYSQEAGASSVSIVPVYNTAQPTDMLSTALDPLGLTTTVAYGTLSDTVVYDPGKEPNPLGGYVLRGAPNYVVTALMHNNDPKINSLGIATSITKQYHQAVINNLGRGWMGFESISTTNNNDNILTIEHYFQTFPKNGVKSRIDTLTVAEKPTLLVRQTTDYQAVKVSKQASWNIWHVNKLFDKVETMGTQDVSGQIVGSRVQLTEFTSDVNGNVTLKHSSELQGDKPVFDSWERCMYADPIKGITGLMTAKKLSNVYNPATDMTTFAASEDLSLERWVYDPVTALAKESWHWSDEADKFLVTTHGYDVYGNEISSKDPLGLTTLSFYDDIFHNLLVTTVEQGDDDKIMSRQRMAYDTASGSVVANLATNGRLSCTKVDGFGRPIETRMQAIGMQQSMLSASGFLGESASYVADKEFAISLGSTDPSTQIFLSPFRNYSYDRVKGPVAENPSLYMAKSTISHFGESVDMRSEALQLFDCIGQQCKQRLSQGSDNKHIVWNYWTYDTRGNVLFESFPLGSVSWNNFEYRPSSDQGTTSVFDQLGRVTTQSRPSHNDTTIKIASTIQYDDGGATVRETVKCPSPNVNTPDATLLFTPKSYVSINGREHVIQVTNGKGHVSNFQYDVAGNLVQATGPGGKKETRTYTSLGQLKSITNPYQSAPDPAHPPKDPNPSMTYTYDKTGQLIKTTNVAGEIITFERDNKGRPLRKSGSDGRVLVYEYGRDGIENLLSMTVYPTGSHEQFESKVVFEYDILGRMSSRTLTLADNGPYKTTLTYDLQGQTVSKTYPNGAVKRNQYTGSLLASSNIFSASDSTCSSTPPRPLLSSRFDYDNGFDKPDSILVDGDSMERQFMHNMTYDGQRYTLGHTMSTSNPKASGQNSSKLVELQYLYNGADQLAQISELVAATTTEYEYDGRRLLSSKTDDKSISSYVYDESGNITSKAGMTLAYTSNSVTGTDTQGSNVLNVRYDPAGRMSSRMTMDIPLTTFEYNSFGLMKSFSNKEDDIITTLTCGPDGKTVRRQMGDGKSSLVTVSDDYSVQRLADGSTTVTLKLFGAGLLLATHSTTSPTTVDGKGKAKGKGFAMSTAVASDHKGNITHRFRGSDATPLETITYDDFGMPSINPPSEKGGPSTGTDNLPSQSTYEGRRLDPTTSLLDFGSRHYDPVIGRFTTPDTLLSTHSLSQTDGLNRFTFENNDPINHVDPTGHFSFSAFVGAAIGGLMVLGAAAITFATGGAAAPLAAAAAGALFSGGVAGMKYSIDHRNQRGGKFWAGYGATVGINAGIGFATGALGAVASSAAMASATGRLSQAAGWSLGSTTETLFAKAATVGARALVDGTGSLLQTVAGNAVENKFHGAHYGLFEGAGKAFGMGAVSGGVAGYKALKGVSDDGSWVSILGVDGSESAFKAARGQVVGAAKSVGLHIAQDPDVVDRASQMVRHGQRTAQHVYHEQQRHFKSLSSLVGSSGFVGSLQSDLMKNQSFVNYG
ncbi:Rhs repeat-associated core [Moelleriella libera RCEF 2490]|uniref:Rhs repeat-associated core n=1 Tax=Moelleriella libera RCEF 2490 TaxID=1081109 RepID=A0A167YVN8_9HYPO|nr:Rhs repeat-associated core [Moelleriella libera RCEF 2490]